jgi:hypothetical protein
MCRSSRFLCFMMVLLVQPACAEPMLGSRAMPSAFARAPVPGYVPRLAATPGRQRFRDATRAIPALGFRSRRNRFVDGSYAGDVGGYGAESLGLDTLGSAVPPPAVQDGGGPDGPRGPLVIPAPRVACAPPLLIKVGRGSRLPSPTTRVVYGAPPCGF